jgi:pimeloyl-ACP methyl ester carboxylesterase
MEVRTIDGAHWSFLETEGDGPPIVLLPGSVGTCEVFFKQIAALGSRHRIVAVTYPGIGDPARLADGLAGLQQALGLEDALIAGSSFAAYWLQFFALRHPGRVRKLLLGNGFVEGTALRDHPLFAPSLVLERGPEEVQRIWYDRVSAAPASELREIQLDMLSGRQSADVLHSRLVSVISAAPCPPPSVAAERIVVLDCADDPIITEPMRRAFRDRYPAATAITLPSGGHYPHILNPEGYDAVLARSILS